VVWSSESRQGPLPLVGDRADISGILNVIEQVFRNWLTRWTASPRVEGPAWIGRRRRPPSNEKPRNRFSPCGAKSLAAVHPSSPSN
jgi:hypothetical protein